MSYTGNPSLAPAVRDRILGTFEHTLELASRGNRHEASLGCDFILQMDPQFGPARALQERLGEGSGPVEVGDLRAGVLAGGPDELDAPPSPAGAEPAGGAGASKAGLRLQLQERLDERDFSGVQLLAQQNPEAIEGDSELARLVETATARQEAAPYVQRFLDAARKAAEEGDPERAAAMVEKARHLDPTHPGVREPAVPTPPAAAPAAAPELSSFSGALGDHDAEGSDRISELLAEGQGAYERGDYQGAIDSWSRIFLIDIDHAEASKRIDQARRLKAEQERRVEEIFHEATDRLDAGDSEAARSGFVRVLELNPGHLAARESLDRLDRLDEGGRDEPAAVPEAPSPPAQPATDLASAAAAAVPLKEEILIPPSPGESPRRGAIEPPPTMAATAGRGPRLRFALIGSAVLVLLVAVVAFLYFERDRYFPNATEPPAAAAADDPITRATNLHDDGKTAMAINQLRRLPPGDAHYDEAQALISQWEAAVEPGAGQTPAPSPEALAQRFELVGQATTALENGENLEALERFDRAAAIAPLEGPEAELRERAERALEPYQSEVGMFRDGDYESAMPRLWRLHEDEPNNPDVVRMLVDSYYNLAVRDLQRGDTKVAAQKLEEAVALAPNDPELERHLRFAETYRERPPDLQFRIYVKYLPSR